MTNINEYSTADNPFAGIRLAFVDERCLHYLQLQIFASICARDQHKSSFDDPDHSFRLFQPCVIQFDDEHL